MSFGSVVHKNTNYDAFSTVDSEKFQYGGRVIYAVFFFFPRVLGQRTVIFQLYVFDYRS